MAVAISADETQFSISIQLNVSRLEQPAFAKPQLGGLIFAFRRSLADAWVSCCLIREKHPSEMLLCSLYLSTCGTEVDICSCSESVKSDSSILRAEPV